MPTSLEPVQKPVQTLATAGLDLARLLEARPGVREKALFANKLAALVDAGVPIVRSLDLMAGQQRMPLFKRALYTNANFVASLAFMMVMGASGAKKVARV